MLNNNIYKIVNKYDIDEYMDEYIDNNIEYSYNNLLKGGNNNWEDQIMKVY